MKSASRVSARERLRTGTLDRVRPNEASILSVLISTRWTWTAQKSKRYLLPRCVMQPRAIERHVPQANTNELHWSPRRTLPWAAAEDGRAL